MAVVPVLAESGLPNPIRLRDAVIVRFLFAEDDGAHPFDDGAEKTAELGKEAVLFLEKK